MKKITKFFKRLFGCQEVKILTKEEVEERVLRLKKMRELEQEAKEIAKDFPDDIQNPIIK